MLSPLALLLAASSASAFVVPYHTGVSKALPARTVGHSMGLFDGFAKAFENDDSLGKAGPAGLKKDATTKTVTWVGPNGQKKVSTAIPGQKLRAIARSSGIPIRYDCGEGTCKSCEAMVGRGRAKICVTSMPNKDVTIKYNIRG